MSRDVDHPQIEPYPQDLRERVLAALRDGQPQREVARDHGVSEPTVCRWRKHAGIPGRFTWTEAPKYEARTARLLLRLELLRQKAELSPDEWAERAGVDPTTLARIRRGATRRPRLETLHALGRALGLTREDLR